MSPKMLTIAHLVSPYLFQTGSWIHTQLTHARSTRPVVLTAALDHPERFPFAPVYHTTGELRGLAHVRNSLQYYLAGRYDPALYLPLLKREDVAVIHAHMGWEGARALPIALAAKLPLVTTFYGRDAGVLPRRPWWRMRFQRLFRHVTAVTAEGPHLGRTLQALGCPAQKIHVVHLGIDIARIPFALRRPEPDGTVEILISSSLRPKKGVPAAVAAFAAVARQFPKTRLRILGDGPERGRVESQIRRHDLQERVTLEGYVSYERHIAALGGAHLFVAASRTARNGDTEGGAPVALIEAQASGLPILATRHADIPEIVADGQSGLLSPEFDDDALARNLEWLLAHPEEWPAMGRRGAERMRAEFEAGRQAEAFAELYRRLI